ncbi:phosphoribosyl-AMP cyclohydrolase [Candidatus Kaiserbacteria bacterium]|nr:phosphoribosyl-AMP cyclohydrolase [Candidatus Kaiserbacteria bacterium]
MRLLEPNFAKDPNGLVAVVVQDDKTKEVLMLAYTDRAGWQKSIETNKVSLYSRSRKKSWVKGEESGNFMQIVDMRIDCDGDAILFLVNPQGKGVACHTNARSCFYRDFLGKMLMPAPEHGEKEELLSVEFELKNSQDQCR